MKNRALSSFSHPQEDARAEGLDTNRCWILMDSHRLATQTRLLRLAHAIKCRRQRSPCRRQQLRLEALHPCALLHRVQRLGSENLNRLNLVVSAGCEHPRTPPSRRAHSDTHPQTGCAGDAQWMRKRTPAAVNAALQPACKQGRRAVHSQDNKSSADRSSEADFCHFKTWSSPSPAPPSRARACFPSRRLRAPTKRPPSAPRSLCVCVRARARQLSLQGWHGAWYAQATRHGVLVE